MIDRRNTSVALVWVALSLACAGAQSLTATEASPAERLIPFTEQSTSEAVPGLVRFSGQVKAGSGEPVALRFALYSSATGQSALWSERQMVTPKADGRYEVLLGAQNALGVPAALFQSGEPRWLGVSEEREGSSSEISRTLLTTVPFAAKAADAETLHGVPASDFVTQEELQNRLQGVPGSAGARNTAVAGNGTKVATSPTGSGTPSAIPLWTSATTLGSANLFQTGSSSAPHFGLGTNTPATTLDVAGNSTLRGNLSLLAPANTVPVNNVVSSPILSQTAKVAISNGTSTYAFGWQATAAPRGIQGMRAS